ncbi:MAG: hypothetical protein Q3986_05455 [Akkermansia sp.]|nr:hypothetical protein [Akkermansia sp.]
MNQSSEGHALGQPAVHGIQPKLLPPQNAQAPGMKKRQAAWLVVLAAVLVLLAQLVAILLYVALSNRIGPNKFAAHGYPDHSARYLATPLSGVVYHEGMLAVQSCLQSRWGQRNFPNGGHVFEGWNKDATHRVTLLVLEPNNAEIAAAGPHCADGLPRAAIQIFDPGSGQFGWLKVGSDSRYDTRGGWDFTDTWCRANTPVTFRKQTRPQNMPCNTPVAEGTFYVDEAGVPHLFANGKWSRFVMQGE